MGLFWTPIYTYNGKYTVKIQSVDRPAVVWQSYFYTKPTTGDYAIDISADQIGIGVGTEYHDYPFANDPSYMGLLDPLNTIISSSVDYYGYGRGGIIGSLTSDTDYSFYLGGAAPTLTSNFSQGFNFHTLSSP